MYEKEKYLKFLKLELTHLIDDITSVIKYEKELHDEDKHTNFVYLENLVVLKDEIMGINGIIGEIDKLELESLDSIEDELLLKIKKFVEKRGYPNAVYELVQNKIRKIREFKGIC